MFWMGVQVLGYDVLLDEVLQPWLIEVNHSPSFTTDTPLDLAIKEGVITDAMHLVSTWRHHLASRRPCAFLSQNRVEMSWCACPAGSSLQQQLPWGCVPYCCSVRLLC